MDANRFDAISRLFAQRRLSRRGALKGAGVGLAAGALGSAASAQDATPAAEATPAGIDAMAKTAYLFVQSFQSGSISPKDGENDRYTLTLEAGLGQTLYFSDRPERIVGATPTPRFLAGLGFPDDNPPNAALVVETGPGKTDIAVVELFTPVYDEATHTATYEVEVLANWENSTELGFTEAPTDLAAVAPAFGAAHLFIDDCPNGTLNCYLPDPDDFGSYVLVESRPIEYCWSFPCCSPCNPDLDRMCADSFPPSCASDLTGSGRTLCRGEATSGQILCT